MQIKKAKIEKFKPIQRRPFHKKFIKELSEASGYPEYFITDFYDHFVAWFHTLVSSGETVHLPNIGRFQRMRVKPKVYYSPLYQKHVLSYTSDSVSYRPAKSMRLVMKKARERGDDAKAYMLWLTKLYDEGKLSKELYDKALEDFRNNQMKDQNDDADSDDEPA